MITVTLLRERIEVPAPRRGRPSYRWTNGYYVCDPTKGGLPVDHKIYPPVIRKEAYALARQLFGADCKISVKDPA